jgi:hypothetical protein
MRLPELNDLTAGLQENARVINYNGETHSLDDSQFEGTDHPTPYNAGGDTLCMTLCQTFRIAMRSRFRHCINNTVILPADHLTYFSRRTLKKKIFVTPNNYLYFHC